MQTLRPAAAELWTTINSAAKWSGCACPPVDKSLVVCQHLSACSWSSGMWLCVRSFARSVQLRSGWVLVTHWLKALLLLLARCIGLSTLCGTLVFPGAPLVGTTICSCRVLSTRCFVAVLLVVLVCAALAMVHPHEYYFTLGSSVGRFSCCAALSGIRLVQQQNMLGDSRLLPVKRSAITLAAVSMAVSASLLSRWHPPNGGPVARLSTVGWMVALAEGYIAGAAGPQHICSTCLVEDSFPLI